MKIKYNYIENLKNCLLIDSKLVFKKTNEGKMQYLKNLIEENL